MHSLYARHPINLGEAASVTRIVSASAQEAQRQVKQPALQHLLHDGLSGGGIPVTASKPSCSRECVARHSTSLPQHPDSTQSASLSHKGRTHSLGTRRT